MSQLLVKFCSHQGDGTKRTFNVSCQSYASQSTVSGLTYITVFNSAEKVDGIDYIVCSNSIYEGLDDIGKKLAKDYYQSCYVENSAGKTINHF